MGTVLMAHAPMVALVHTIKEPAGSMTAELFANPLGLSVRLVVFMNRLLSAATSDGVHHGTSPSQKEGVWVEGVPPETTAPSEPSGIQRQGSRSNSLNRFLPVRSTCINPR